jgi:hypothetical protein
MLVNVVGKRIEALETSQAISLVRRVPVTITAAEKQ